MTAQSLRVLANLPGPLQCTFWHDLALGGSNKLLPDLGIGQSVRSAVALSLHDTGHLEKLTFLGHQSISGLCSTSHMCLRMMVIQPIPVMWKVAVSE